MSLPNEPHKFVAELISVTLYRWQQSAIELQAYRRAAESNPSLQQEIAQTLASPRFVERLHVAETLRNQALRAAEADNPQGFSEALAELAALLGATPSTPIDQVRETR